MEQISLVIYSGHREDIDEVITELHEEGIPVKVEISEDCMENLEVSILDTLQKKNPNMIIIDNDETGNGLILFKIIKDEGTLENIPVVFIGIENRAMKIHALSLGALDYIVKPLDKEVLKLKINNFINFREKNVLNKVYDMLTGVYLRNTGEEIAQKKFEICLLRKEDFTVLVADIDNMSKVNHNLGKAVEDTIIKECASIFKKFLEPCDFIYRYSYGKFIFVFLGKNTLKVLKLAKEILEKVKKLTEKYNIDISFTGAVASLDNNTKTYKNLIAIAFENLASGKLENRGQIYINEVSQSIKMQRTILIINEDNVITTILSLRYRSKGFKVLTSCNLEDAQSILANNEIDLVLTDYIMPGISGVDIIKRLKSINKNIKIIIVSQQKSESSIETALKNGAEDYVVKPFSPVELDSRINRLFK